MIAWSDIMAQYQLHLKSTPTTLTTGYQTPPVPEFDHSQCGQTFLLFSFAPPLTSPIPGDRPTSPHPSPTPIADHFPNRPPSATPPLFLSLARRCSLPSPTRSIDHERRTPPFASVEPRYSFSRKLPMKYFLIE